MKSVTSKLAIIILSLLASTHTFAFSHDEVCKAMNDAVRAESDGAPTVYWGPITNIYSRKTDGSDPRGEVVGKVGGWPDRLSSQSGLECSGETCHVNKKWDDCECTSSACADDEDTANDNARKVCENTNGFTLASAGGSKTKDEYVAKCIKGMRDGDSKWVKELGFDDMSGPTN